MNAFARTWIHTIFWHRDVTAEKLNLRVNLLHISVNLELELTPFDRHLIVHQEGVQDAQTAYPQAAVLGAISPANGRTRSGWAQPQ